MKRKNILMIVSVLLLVFVFGFISNSVYTKIKMNNPGYYVNETEHLIIEYSGLPDAIDSIEERSILYYDTANTEMLHYMLEYKHNIIVDNLDYYITHFGDTIAFNKENFFYYVSMYTVAENLLETRKHIINGLMMNIQLNTEENRNKIVE